MLEAEAGLSMTALAARCNGIRQKEHPMGDKKSKKDKAKEHRQHDAKAAKAAKKKQDKSQPRNP